MSAPNMKSVERPTLIPNDRCPNCDNAHLTYEAGSHATYDDPGDEPMLHCEECDYEAEIAWDAWNHEKQVFWRLNDAQKKRLDALEKRIDEVYPQPTKEDACSWEDTFKYMPEGQFKYDDSEAGDWTPWCDDKPVSWTQSADAYDIGRDKDGKRWLERRTVDRDGNWDFVWRLEDNDDGTEPKDAWEYLLDMHCHHHLRAVSKYYVYIAETGDDCLDYYYYPKNLTPEQALDSLERYLK